MYFTNLNLPVEGGVIKPGLDVVVGCTYFMALITLSLFFRRRVGGGGAGAYGAIYSRTIIRRILCGFVKVL